MDYIGFTYNKKHSVRDLGLYRTSNGSRYTTNLAPTMTTDTAQNNGADGQYLFDTHFKQQQFTIDFAFDNLDETKIRTLRQLFNGREEGELIFDEYPYKAYSAKPTGSPNLKAICFMENGQRIYKGEGSITFTCYQPFAHTPDWVWYTEDGITYEPKEADGRIASNYGELAYPTKNEWLKVSGLTDNTNYNWGEIAAPFAASPKTANTLIETMAVCGNTITILGDFPSGAAAFADWYLVWDSKSGLVYTQNELNERYPVPYEGNALAKIPPKSKISCSDNIDLKFHYWYY